MWWSGPWVIAGLEEAEFDYGIAALGGPARMIHCSWRGFVMVILDKRTTKS